ncbi:hypothetical protein JF544_07765 [Halobacillus kuroshimensis]|uniref:Uncharacterized protein n=1 Tax=Halobacillus kuroshimensis TaxID=302481 RepID=A0ABS3DUW0_9BACI|nr:hypothetical protein [Halobacillus kuroshimensis]MBN8235144.1 hypothetical protein [Halobacillus kuroshimensis]
MTNSDKKEYLLLPTSNSSLYIELLGQNPVMAMTTWKDSHIKTEAPTKAEAIQEMLDMIEKNSFPY